jgi:hypothetical protein
MKKSNVLDVMLTVWHQPNKWVISFRRNEKTNLYFNASFHSVLRLTRLANKLVFERKGVVYPTSSGWICVIQMNG